MNFSQNPSYIKYTQLLNKKYKHIYILHIHINLIHLSMNNLQHIAAYRSKQYSKLTSADHYYMKRASASYNGNNTSNTNVNIIQALSYQYFATLKHNRSAHQDTVL